MEEKENKVPFTSKNYFLILENPIHSYHGNHWFHFGEHFLSRFQEIAPVIGSLPNHSNLYLLCNNWKLLSLVTQFTFYLLVLSTWHPNLSSIRLLRVGQSSFSTVPLLSSFTSPSIIDQWELGQETIVKAYPTPFRYSKEESSPTTRFMDSSIAIYLKEFTGVVIGGIGDYPIFSTGWFQNPEKDIPEVQYRMQALCFGSEMFDPDRYEVVPKVNNNVEEEKEEEEERKRARGESRFRVPSLKSSSIPPVHHIPKYRLVIYQRDVTRKIIHFQDLVDEIRLHLNGGDSPNKPSWEILPIIHSEQRNPCFLYEIMKNTDVFLSLHGFQFTGKTN